MVTKRPNKRQWVVGTMNDGTWQQLHKKQWQWQFCKKDARLKCKTEDIDFGGSIKLAIAVGLEERWQWLSEVSGRKECVSERYYRTRVSFFFMRECGCFLRQQGSRCMKAQNESKIVGPFFFLFFYKTGQPSSSSLNPQVM